MSDRFHSVEIIIETTNRTKSLIEYFLPGVIHSGEVAPEVQVLGSDLCDATITKIVCRDLGSTKLVICPSPSSLTTAEASILELCRIVSSLPISARREWDQANKREFYVGYDLDGKGTCFTDRFSDSTVIAVASIKASIGIAIYRGRNQDLDEEP